MGLAEAGETTDELAVKGGNREDFGNPLRLRRPLEQGVRVLVAHCASLGTGLDLDAGSRPARVDNFALFVRLMEEPNYQGLLFGDPMSAENYLELLMAQVDGTDSYRALFA